MKRTHDRTARYRETEINDDANLRDDNLIISPRGNNDGMKRGQNAENGRDESLDASPRLVATTIAIVDDAAVLQEDDRRSRPRRSSFRLDRHIIVDSA